jgi:hypothetical protein
MYEPCECVPCYYGMVRFQMEDSSSAYGGSYECIE